MINQQINTMRALIVLLFIVSTSLSLKAQAVDRTNFRAGINGGLVIGDFSEAYSFVLGVDIYHHWGVSKEIDKGATLADVLEESGVPIIIACRSGMCGSCKCKVEKGEVSRTSTETLSEEDIAQGYTLACSSQVQSDVEVSLI